jgi:hypothetical protein
MTAPVDPFPDFQPGAIADANQVDARFKALYDALNGTNPGALDLVTLSTALKQALSVGPSARAKSVIASSESRSGSSYGLMPTPDRVQNVVLPTDGLIFVAYQATWSETNLGAGKAAIFIGPTQLHIAAGQNNPVQQAVIPSGGPSVFASLATTTQGLLSLGAGGSDYVGDVTTGQVLGGNQGAGSIAVFAAAGTYDVSVQFSANTGSVSVKNRKLWVWTEAF